MKKFLSILGVASATTLSLLLITAPEALGAKNNPHHEEQDGCDHGNSNKPCKPDPQPDHGKECEKHGNHGGINEDHCLNPTTTTTVPTTPTTQPPTSPTTVTTSPSGGTVGSTPTTVSTPVGAETPAPATPGSSPSTPGVTLESQPAGSTEPLAHTGIGSTLMWIGLILALSGAVALFLGKFVKVGGGE